MKVQELLENKRNPLVRMLETYIVNAYIEDHDSIPGFSEVVSEDEPDFWAEVTMANNKVTATCHMTGTNVELERPKDHENSGQYGGPVWESKAPVEKTVVLEAHKDKILPTLLKVQQEAMDEHDDDDDVHDECVKKLMGLPFGDDPLSQLDIVKETVHKTLGQVNERFRYSSYDDEDREEDPRDEYDPDEDRD